MDSSLDAPQSKDGSSEGLFDRLLDRYITVWIWSVLFGASTGLVIDLITYRTDSRWGPLNAILVLILLVSLVAAVISWRALMKCMSVYLIPKFVLHRFNHVESLKHQEASLSTEESEELRKSLAKKETEAERMAADYLRRSFEYLVFGAVARVVITLLEMVYASLKPF